MPRRLVHDDEPTGLLDRLEDRRRVERRERASVDHLGADSLAGELLGRRERLAHRPADADDRHVAPLAAHRGLADRDHVLALRDVAVLQRQQVVVEEDHRVVVADRRGHQALRVRGRRGNDDLETRDAHEHAVDRARVLSGPAGGEAVARLEHERHLHLPGGHGVEAGSLVHDLVHGDEHELRHVQLDDRPVAGERGPDRHPDLRGLRDRRHADAIVAEGLHVGVVLGEPEVLTEVEDRVVALHLLMDRLADRGDVGKLACHHAPWRRSGSAERGSVADP